MDPVVKKANFILQHAGTYQRDAIFRQIVDATVYITDEERMQSINFLDNILD